RHPHHRVGRRRPDRRAAPRRAVPRHRAGQGCAERRVDGLGTGRDRGGAGAGRYVRQPCRRHDGRR
ncbi:hypothetical protein LTR94_038455, partial [Friedmanniomyces endolithicus]